MTCACGCAHDEHDDDGPCDRSRTDKRHMCGGYEDDGE